MPQRLGNGSMLQPYKTHSYTTSVAGGDRALGILGHSEGQVLRKVYPKQHPKEKNEDHEGTKLKTLNRQ